MRPRSLPAGTHPEPLMLGAVALAALLAGAGVAAATARGASALEASVPPPGAAALGSTLLFGLPGQAPFAGGPPMPGRMRASMVQLLMGGRVVAVSSKSITICARNHTVTAAITSATQFSGRVKAGDAVSAQIAESHYGNHATVMAIQDPPVTP